MLTRAERERIALSYLGLIATVVSRLLGSRAAHDRVEELADTVVCKLLEADTFYHYDPTRLNEKAWVAAITRNLVKDSFKSIRPGVTIGDGEGEADIPADEPTPEDAYLEAELLGELRGALDTLSSDDRALLTELDEQGDAGRMGAERGHSANAVRIRKCRALARLRNAVK